MATFGFIVLRHVNNELTNQFWIKCIYSIRLYYPETKILIIDDNSDYNFINTEHEKLYNLTVIKSEYPGRGELLPYYYYLHNKLFDIAIIIHDSVVVNEPINVNDAKTDKFKILWEFEHDWDQIEDETVMINSFNNTELKEFYENKDLWKGCFGGMSIIKHDFLLHLHYKYDLHKLLELVRTRYNRMSFERVIACLLQKEGNKETLFGNIHRYCRWGITFNEINDNRHLPFIKYWSGR